MLVSRVLSAAFLAMIVAGSLMLPSSSAAQKKLRPARQQPVERPVTQPTPQPTPQVQSVKRKAGLVTVPVVVTNPAGQFVQDLQLSEFEIFEGDVKQEVASLANGNDPLGLVLMLDTSTSTQAHLSAMRKAAVAFVDQLPKTDRVKIITFDDQVRELNDFTADRAAIKSAILKAQPGYGTKFYDAMNVALESVREVEGRKAIVIFSDGVDYRSDYGSAESTLRILEEDGVLVYPIRFSTRASADRLAREQAGQSAQLPTSDVVRSTSGGTGTTLPDDPGSVPGGQRRTGPLGLPLPDDILRRRRDSRDRDRLPPGDRPPAGEVGTDLPTGRSDPRVRAKSPEKAPEDTIGVMLDRLYLPADSYLKALADKSGGLLLRADDITALPAAFSQIATELHTPYFLGYYPINKSTDDQYRLIKVTTARKDLVIRAREGRRPPKPAMR